MDTWPAFVAATLQRHGVASTVLATEHGVGLRRFQARTAREAWRAPAARVRIHPDSPRSVQQRLLAACEATRAPAAAGGEAAAWLYGVRPRPPRRLEIVLPATTRGASATGVLVRRARWLEPTDVEVVDHVPVLRPPAWLLARPAPDRETLRARLIDLLHRGQLDADGVRERFSRVGPVPGKAGVLTLVEELAALRQESIFQALVADELARLGYGARRTTRAIRAGDVRLRIDVPLPAWKVAVEPDGDAFHRTREQRRRDRRRLGAYAGTDWVPVPVDWRDWHLDRASVLRRLDRAIANQRRRGIGVDHLPPRRA